jgi:hypothetical protein
MAGSSEDTKIAHKPSSSPHAAGEPGHLAILLDAQQELVSVAFLLAQELRCCFQLIPIHPGAASAQSQRVCHNNTRPISS